MFECVYITVEESEKGYEIFRFFNNITIVKN